MKELRFSKSETVFILTLFLSHACFFIYAVFWGNIYVGDSTEYILQSVNIKDHLNWYSGVFSEPYDLDLYSRRPPMYGFFIFLIKLIYNSDYLVLFFQSCLSIINFLGLMSLLKSYSFKTNIYIILTIFIIVYPSQLIYANLILSEILFQTFLFWAFYNFVKFIKNSGNKYIFYYNVLIMLAALTKPVLYLFWIFNLVFMIYFFFKDRKNYSPVIYGLIPLTAVLIISFYNYKVTGYYHYSSLKHNNLYDLNSKFLLLNKLGEEKANKIFKSDSLRFDSIKDYSERSIEKEKTAITVINDNLTDYIKLHLKGMVIFFIDPGRFDIAVFFGKNNTSFGDSGIYYIYLKDGFRGVLNYIFKLPFAVIVYLTIVMIINILMLVSIINFIFQKRTEPEIRIYFILIIAYTCILSGNIGALRFKIPLLQIILFSMPFLFDRFKSPSGLSK